MPEHGISPSWAEFNLSVTENKCCTNNPLYVNELQLFYWQELVCANDSEPIKSGSKMHQQSLHSITQPFVELNQSSTHYKTYSQYEHLM